MRNPSLLRRFASDEGGAIIVWFALTLVAILGVFGLSLDLGRATDLHTEMQSIADAAALAAANKLDGSVNSVATAKAAAEAVGNDAKLASNAFGQSPRIATFRWFANLDDVKANKPLAYAETDPDEASRAAFVEVTTHTRTSTATLIRVVGGNDTTVSASAVAGSSYVACDVTPLMMCNPLEGTAAGKLTSADIGKQFRLKAKGGNGKYFPGDFGLLDPPNMQNGSDPIAENLASSKPHVCYVNQMTVTPGDKTDAVNDGIGVRFNIPVSGNSAAAQALNAMGAGPVSIRGRIGKNDKPDTCKFSNQPEPATDPAMPRDTCMPAPGSPPSTAGSCGGPMGDGQFNWSAYRDAHHPGQDLSSYKTRFSLYLAETGCDAATLQCNAASATLPPSKTTEDWTPHCPSLQTAGGLDRRLIQVAFVNCNALADAGTSVSGNSAVRLQGAQYATFFLTEPADSGQIYAELVKFIEPGADDGKLHHMVQLYR